MLEERLRGLVEEWRRDAANLREDFPRDDMAAEEAASATELCAAALEREIGGERSDARSAVDGGGVAATSGSQPVTKGDLLPCGDEQDRTHPTAGENPASPIPDQPPPTGSGVPVWPLVIADMQARDAAGTAKYGTPLRTHNGRDALVDAYQEALDLAVYLRQRIEEDAPPLNEEEEMRGFISWAQEHFPRDFKTAPSGPPGHREFVDDFTRSAWKGWLARARARAGGKGR